MQNTTHATPLTAALGQAKRHARVRRAMLDTKYGQALQSVRTASVLVHTSASRGLDDEEIDQN